MDPAGLAPASLGVKASILLHVLRAQVHIAMINKKAPFRKETFLFDT